MWFARVALGIVRGEERQGRSKKIEEVWGVLEPYASPLVSPHLYLDLDILRLNLCCGASVASLCIFLVIGIIGETSRFPRGKE